MRCLEIKHTTLLVIQSPSTTVSTYGSKFRATLKVISTPGMVAHNCDHSMEKKVDGMKVSSSLKCSALASLHTHQVNLNMNKENDCHILEPLGLP